MTLSRELTEILVCPACRGPVRAAPSGEGLDCDRCRLRYPVIDDIPAMLPEEALRLGTARAGPGGVP